MKTAVIEPPSPSALAKVRTLGPVSDLERHLPAEWWKTLFNSFYLKTDGDVVENTTNTVREVDMLLRATKLQAHQSVLDLCCGQGRHSLELASRGFTNVSGIDRSRYLIRLARKRAKQFGLNVRFSEGDARKIRLPESSLDCVVLFGNSFGYFEHQEDDVHVLESIKQVLKPQAKLVLDIVDGSWMRDHFEPRSWEWIDQNYFVCRERSLSSDRSRIVSREVIVHAELGVIADQFYAERLYSYEEISEVLKKLGFRQMTAHGNLQSDSLRGHDLGMMANRLFISAIAPKKPTISLPVQDLETLVIMGDPRLPDKVKKNNQFNAEDLETVKILKKTLKRVKGFKFDYLNNHKTLLRQLSDNPPAFVFNLCDEGFNNNPAMEANIPAMLEMLGVPYTGAGPDCLGLCYNKSAVQAIAARLDIPVPLQTYYSPSDQAISIPSIFPAILKPNQGDGSQGITKEAVVYNAEALIAYADQLREQFPHTPILIEEFLSGPEYSLALIGNPGSFEVLPVLTVNYSKLPKDLPRILSYESKFMPGTPHWDLIEYEEATLDEESYRHMVDSAKLLFERLHCRDYARFDFRTDNHGVIKLLEVNPNPGWCWDGKLNLMAQFRGLTYHELLEAILKAARERLAIDPKGVV